MITSLGNQFHISFSGDGLKIVYNIIHVEIIFVAETRFNKSCQCRFGGEGDKSYQTERLEYFWGDMFTEYQLIIASIIKGCIQYPKFQVATSIISKFKHIKLNEHNSLRKTFEQETKYGLFGPRVRATIIHLTLSQNLTEKP